MTGGDPHAPNIPWKNNNYGNKNNYGYKNLQWNRLRPEKDDQRSTLWLLPAVVLRSPASVYKTQQSEGMFRALGHRP